MDSRVCQRRRVNQKKRTASAPSLIPSLCMHCIGSAAMNTYSHSPPIVITVVVWRRGGSSGDKASSRGHFFQYRAYTAAQAREGAPDLPSLSKDIGRPSLCSIYLPYPSRSLLHRWNIIAVSHLWSIGNSQLENSSGISKAHRKVINSDTDSSSSQNPLHVLLWYISVTFPSFYSRMNLLYVGLLVSSFQGYPISNRNLSKPASYIAVCQLTVLSTHLEPRVLGNNSPRQPDIE